MGAHSLRVGRGSETACGGAPWDSEGKIPSQVAGSAHWLRVTFCGTVMCRHAVPPSFLHDAAEHAGSLENGQRRTGPSLANHETVPTRKNIPSLTSEAASTVITRRKTLLWSALE